MAKADELIELENLARWDIDLGTFEHGGKPVRVYLGSRDDRHGVQDPDETKGECHAPIKRYPRGVVEQGMKLKAWQGLISQRELAVRGTAAFAL